MERRDFIKSAVASAVTAGGTLNASGHAQSAGRTNNPGSRPMSPDTQYRDLGRTGSAGRRRASSERVYSP
jgi:hypothetical protein